LRFNLSVARHADDVLILAGDHIYKMDYRPMLRFHHEHDADVTLAVRAVPSFDTYRYGMVAVDTDGRVADFEEKPRRTTSTLASMGVYIFKPEALADCLLEGPGKRAHDLGRDVIPALVRSAKVSAYTFHGFWADVGTVQAYYEANMALLAETPALDLYDPARPVYTRSEERPAVLLGADARAQGNLLCDGCRIEGTVNRSIISPGVYVAPGATVRDSIVMTDAVIEAGAEVDRSILDKRVLVAAGAKVGWGEVNTSNSKWPERLNTGLTLVGKEAMIPAGHTVGRNVVIYPKVSAKDYAAAEVASGETIGG
jgi:glucose-1-phosphate adenylyltransferase